MELSSAVPRGWVPFRRRKVLSPFSRGALLLAVFLVWICLSNTVFYNEGEGDVHGWKGRTLLNASEMKEIGSEEDAYDADGNVKKNICLRPAIEQFPEPLMGKTARRYGGLIIHICVAVYMFVGLAIVCDDYFVPSLDKIAAVLNMDPDVAGATFMAAGSSGPELATAVIGVFVAKDDIGVSGVIGSAVFNITFVIALCALVAEQMLYLNWWPVVRDCSCYLISILVLLITISNEIVSWYEAVFFLLLYVLYCVGMAFNSKIEVLVKSKLRVPESWNFVRPLPGTGLDPKDPEGGYGQMDGKNEPAKSNGKESDGLTDVPMSPPNQALAKEPLENPLEKPTDGNKFKLFKWALLFPLYFISSYTIPDCRTERFSRFFVASFLLAIVWISAYSYMMVWMITVIGFTLAIPDTVMGLTFIAAGVSVPDALSGMAVVKEGHGDMAVSNAIGSNVFDILICLGLPWFLQTAIVEPGSTVLVRSKGLVYSTFSLFSTIIFLIVASHVNGWRLDKKLGVVLMVWYFVFMIFASLYELNVFGEFNPPECESDY